MKLFVKTGLHNALKLFISASALRPSGHPERIKLSSTQGVGGRLE